MNSSIDDLLILLFATTLIVPLMKKLRTSPIIGFLLIGLILGPAGADVIRHIEVSHRIADFGIIFFLFETGLELSVKKVVSMRGDVFGLGMAQFLITGGLLSLISPWISSQLSTGASLLMGGGLALSSSAFALQLLRDKRQLGTRFGRASLGVLLFQDMAVVPLLVLAPLLGDPGGAALPVAIAESFGKAVLALGIVVGTGHFFLRPLLAFVKRSDSSEAFLAVTLGTVLLSSSLTQAFGLSETLGAFVGGVLVAETDYKHQIEADIAPFRGMLLGLFFVTVGFSFDLSVLTHHWLTVVPLLLAVLVLKALVVVVLGLWHGLSDASSLQASALLAPGGEFALVLFRLAEHVGIMPSNAATILVTTSVISMAVTPLLAAGADGVARRLRQRRGMRNLEGQDQRAAADVQEITKSGDGFVAICGYNMIGRTVCNLLDQEGEAQYIVFEDDAAVATEARASGLPVFLADVARSQVLDVFKIGQARVVVVANESRNRANQVATAIRSKFPEMPMIVRAKDSEHKQWLESTLGVKALMPAMIAVRFGTEVMQLLGYPEDEVKALLQELLNSALAEICGEKGTFLTADDIVDAGNETQGKQNDKGSET